ncbi:unnamed protein product [Pleuronectes platessa]|uniref:Secreted protein n=1 Tax=Pleuronectes platessa TaxID=8262 RepID=A0A9N7VBU9_PLEPL|nr:unnamed protein product [Pleuronectes platessa]
MPIRAAWAWLAPFGPAASARLQYQSICAPPPRLVLSNGTRPSSPSTSIFQSQSQTLGEYIIIPPQVHLVAQHLGGCFNRFSSQHQEEREKTKTLGPDNAHKESFCHRKQRGRAVEITSDHILPGFLVYCTFAKGLAVQTTTTKPPFNARSRQTIRLFSNDAKCRLKTFHQQQGHCATVQTLRGRGAVHIDRVPGRTKSHDGGKQSRKKHKELCCLTVAHPTNRPTHLGQKAEM